MSRQQRSTSDTVRQLIAALLPGGCCTAQQVAQHMGVDRRTIHRHLAAEGTTFSQLLDEVRSELVRCQIKDSDLPLAEVAGPLGFSAPSAFGHWLCTTFGCSASQWRRNVQPAPHP